MANPSFAFWHFPELLLNDAGVTLVEYARGTPVDTESSCMDSVMRDQCPSRLHRGRPSEV